MPGLVTQTCCRRRSTSARARRLASCSGLGAKFPAKYQDAIFAFDWAYGTIYAMHLTPTGATYRATKEEFVVGVPLNVTDGVIGKDGNFYFAVGGRGTDSALYRVKYVGSEPTDSRPARQ